ncbi:MAG: two-component system response regulator [Candidatus Muproteobacteria bacterium RBG_16_65_34]|uniref:Two-component system response regulator n=1 Tax=Candidatus Muproteobacteria bacterium RBG_16_65_34 TaxID=1817760 RepID=A0A1F6TPV6_9PROT|nr:MAG: two-component system response regulator [Candidatus Muproteobacteria bacterium RBG_16_65_34]
MAIKNVMVVDDSATDSHLLSEILKKNGYAVTTAASGEEAIIKSKSDKPDLILMDIVMPGMSGFEATRAISKDPATAAIPVIICSTKGQETDKAWGLRQGAKDYIVKPITEKALMEKIKAL